MQFLGLALTDACEFSMFTDEESSGSSSIRVSPCPSIWPSQQDSDADIQPAYL